MTRPCIASVRLVTSAPTLDTRSVASEFPTVKIERAHAARADDAIIDADEWRAARSFAAFDDAVAHARGDGLMIRGDRHVELVACEALTRYQRLVQRRNGSSRTQIFATVLRAHRAACDDGKPLLSKALFERALDTWQWTLRVDPAASLTAQLAALFHDVERLVGEVDAPPSCDAATDEGRAETPESRGGAWMFEVLQKARVEETIAHRVREIVTMHERRGRDAEIDLLSDAEALSFLSLGSGEYLDHLGPDQTRRKLAYTLGRMGDRARAMLSFVRLRPDVRTLLHRAVAA